jgi:hypothetical protein
MNDSKKTINYTPIFSKSNVSHRKTQKKRVPIHDDININSKDIRNVLIQKLKEHKKMTKRILSKNNEETHTSNNDNSNLYNKVRERLSNLRKKKDIEINTQPIAEPIFNDNNNTSDLLLKKTLKESILPKITNDKPYGNLKNGKKKTYKNWIRDNNKRRVETKDIFKKMTLGKTRKGIKVFIKNTNLRNKTEKFKIKNKKTKIQTVKNYLKQKNLIKFGSTCPTPLLRELYENSIIIGDVYNDNSCNLIHNFNSK